MPDPIDIDGWFRLVKQHERSSAALKEDRVTAGQAYYHAGLAVECALKAYIMHQTRANRWPIAARPGLKTHDLTKLMREAGIVLDPKSPLAPGWHTVLQWDRNHSYDPDSMPRKVARGYHEAALGPDGIVTWIRRQLNRNS